ncbi:hypothetical protein BDA96_03G140600 [Sorghum bicolor]|jgi:hypothetical protein|uniref:Uncharacterized protein n=2 Tax=Sorghum bicolor TaxID=4558 RepID=A0A921RBD3_SORBI|nr:hypothetical protein BDA96_03G140600 [Sorghum bicolor]KXG32287.1 hypothetical protein SORBI_3003G134600 [Sorghum bicolor]
MEDLAASLMPYPHSAPLYLLYDAASIANASHGLVGPPLPLLGDDDDDDGFEFATKTAHSVGGAALRACASDVSAAAFADELFRAGALLPLSLPPRLQRPAYSAGASAATSPTATSSAASASFRSSRKHRGFDPFAAALEKVRRDGAGAPVAVRRARSLSPLRGATAGAAVTGTAHAKNSGGGGDSRAAARRARKGKGRGVRHLLCRFLMASAAAAPKALWPRRKDGGVAYRPGLLVCLGYGV